MSEPGIPDAVANFIIEYISSVGQLEVLLFLYLHRNTSWTPQKIAEEMRSSDIAAGQQLRDLHFRQLVTQEGNPGEECYKIQVESSGMDHIMSEMAKYYNGYRVSIIHLIYNKPAEALRIFADAFIIKKEK